MTVPGHGICAMYYHCVCCYISHSASCCDCETSNIIKL